MKLNPLKVERVIPRFSKTGGFLRKILIPALLLFVSVGLLPIYVDGANVATNEPPTEALLQTNAAPKELNDPLRIGIYGPFAKEILDGLNRDSVTTQKGLSLYLDGVPMHGLTATILPPEAFGVPPPGYAQPTLVLQFVLERNANDEANRKSWDTLFNQLNIGPQALEVGVGLNTEIPHLATTSYFSSDPLMFQTRSLWLVFPVIIIGLVILIALMWWLRFTIMLREGGVDSYYSLGKTQMAFWGLLVAISFLGVWIVSLRMERIPSQVLILLGISAGTGLSSVLINNNRGSGQPLQNQANLIRLNVLRDKQKNNQKLDDAESKEMQDLDQKVKAATSLKTWLTDIISDENGMSFHRFQVVIWTIILGCVFVWTVATTFSMPEFESTLLILMGISNGTYIGFKTNEKP